jgi:hypothetical protein
MVEERFEDLRGDPHHISFYGWRCVCCGNIVDPVITRHRAIGLSPVLPIHGVATAHTTPHHSFSDLGLETPAA